MLGGYGTCFGISLDTKPSPSEQKRFKHHRIKAPVIKLVEQYFQGGSGVSIFNSCLNQNS